MGLQIISGNFTVANDAQVNVLGTINNTGTIAVSAAGNNTVLQIQGNVTLTGAGTVTLSTSGNGTAIINEDGASTLTNVNNVIQGEGQIGNNGLTVVNQAVGKINANIAGAVLVLNPNTTLSANNPFGISNQGLMKQLLEHCSYWVPLSTTLQAIITAAEQRLGTAAAHQQCSPAEGGTLSATGGATLGIPGDFFATLDFGALMALITNKNAFTIANDGQLNVIGTINNLGSVPDKRSGQQQFILQIQGNVTLTGGRHGESRDHGQRYIRH